MRRARRALVVVAVLAAVAAGGTVAVVQTSAPAGVDAAGAQRMLFDVAGRPAAPPPAGSPRYSRALFDAEDWHDGDGNGCPEDVDVRARDSVDETRGAGSGSTRRCPAILTGTVLDPYTATRLPMRQVQIDHVVPLGWAYAHGAWAWTPAQRRAYALDQGNLLAVSGSENMRKGDRGPGSGLPGSNTYVPPAPGEHCDYAIRWTVTVHDRGLWLDAAARQWLSVTLARCRS